MIVIGFNGPPRCGKDTIAAMTKAALRPYHYFAGWEMRTESLVGPLREAAGLLVGHPTLFDADYSTFKDAVFGMAPDSDAPVDGRTVMIAISEDAIKPLLGQAYWSQLLLRKFPPAKNENTILFVPDVGFASEVSTLEMTPGVQFGLVQMTRAGCAFESSGDSRRYVETTKAPTLKVQNLQGRQDATAGIVADWILRHFV